MVSLEDLLVKFKCAKKKNMSVLAHPPSKIPGTSILATQINTKFPVYRSKYNGVPVLVKCFQDSKELNKELHVLKEVKSCYLSQLLYSDGNSLSCVLMLFCRKVCLFSNGR